MMDDERARELAEVAARIGVAFADLGLLDRALTHSSILGEARGIPEHYESLEFLGDAALGLAAAHHLFMRAPDRTPGEYSRMRSAVVGRRCLARVAGQLGLAAAIRLGKGEELSGGRERAALLEDCMEAVIGAIHLDQGWDAVREFVGRVFGEEMDRAARLDRLWDFKSRLQHLCQARKEGLPSFRVVRSEGPDHRKEFEVEVLVQGAPMGRGTGMSKKEAEQQAAKAALDLERRAGADDEADGGAGA
jgi:ribonuclease III